MDYNVKESIISDKCETDVVNIKSLRRFWALLTYQWGCKCDFSGFLSLRDLGKGGTVEHAFDKHSIDLEPGNPVRADLASLLVGNRTEPV